jgi:alanine dehydrogenase
LTAIPVFAARHVEAAVPPGEAVEAVRAAFVAYARGEWTMPPKVYAPAYPAGDFRAMPALGGGYALLKWVTSFPGNPARGLPTVTGLVLLSDAKTGMLRAVLDAGAVTALRTGAAAVLAAETVGRPSGTAAVIGAGVNGKAVARTFLARGRRVLLWDIDEERAGETARDLGAEVAPSREDALAADVVVTVTPGREILFPPGSLRPGQHVSLMGADGPGKAEIAPEELARVRAFCDDWEQASRNLIPEAEPRVRLFADDWEQASHNGDLAHAVAAGGITEDDVTQLADVLAGRARGRQHDDDITIFDSTGLAIQDLAIALAAIDHVDELGLQTLDLGA